MRNTCNIFLGKPEGRSPLERPRHRQEDNIWLDLTEMRLARMDWIHLAQDRASGTLL